jgi:hypothetical protein
MKGLLLTPAIEEFGGIERITDSWQREHNGKLHASTARHIIHSELPTPATEKNKGRSSHCSAVR